MRTANSKQHLDLMSTMKTPTTTTCLWPLLLSVSGRQAAPHPHEVTHRADSRARPTVQHRPSSAANRLRVHRTDAHRRHPTSALPGSRHQSSASVQPQPTGFRLTRTDRGSPPWTPALTAIRRGPLRSLAPAPTTGTARSTESRVG